MTQSEGVGRDFLDRSSRFLVEEHLPRVRAAVERLPSDDLWWRPNDASNSVGNLLLHMAGNLRQWVVHGAGGAEDVRDRDAEFAAGAAPPPESGADELLDRLRATVREAAWTLDRTDPATLAGTVRIQGMPVTRLYAVLHAVEHFSMHAGQILWIVKLRTGEDLGFYRIEDGVARRTWSVE